MYTSGAAAAASNNHRLLPILPQYLCAALGEGPLPKHSLGVQTYEGATGSKLCALAGTPGSGGRG